MDWNDDMGAGALGAPSRISMGSLLQKKFRRGFFGARVKEVQEFLVSLADELDHILEENRRLRNQWLDAHAQLEEFRNMETTMRNAVMSSEKYREQVNREARLHADEVIALARKESETILARAAARKSAVEKQIDELIARAAEHKSTVEKQITTLIEQRDAFRRDIAVLVESYLQKLKDPGLSEIP